MIISFIIGKMSQKLTGNTSRQQLRNVCFTKNNPTDVNAYVDRLRDDVRVTYGVVGVEWGESGTMHLQGYLEFKRKIEFTVAHELLERAHLEPRRGPAAAAATYCRKGTQSHAEWLQLGEEGPGFGIDAHVFEWGTRSAQGARSDIREVSAAVANGASMQDIARDFPVQFIYYSRGVMNLKAALIQPRCTVPEVKVFHGPSGSGKSHAAREWLPNAYIWHPQQGAWFDGYQGETEVIFEEFRGQLQFGMMLSLLDRYDCKVQYKGGVVEFAAVRIAITSPKPPTEWWVCLDEHDRVEQLLRRISEVVECRPRAGQTHPPRPYSIL